MSEPTIIISLVVGDWSGDGHDKRETVNIKSNLDKKAMEKAYKKGTKKLGFDFCKDVCAEYEDNKLPPEKLDALVKLGLETKGMGLEYDLKRIKKDEGVEIGLWHDDFVEIYLFIVKLGDDEFTFEYLNADANPTINIGGYGMFY